MGGGKTCFDEDLQNNHLKYICYCGGISEDRNISMLVNIMEKINAELLLAGYVDNGYYKQLETFPGWSKVHYLGYLNQHDVKSMYSKSTIGICVLRNTPNIYYSLPIKLFEYMKAGLPVICSDFPLWKEIIEKNKCGICVQCNDINEVVKTIRFLLDNPIICKKMGINGKKAVFEKYNWENEKDKLCSIYRKVI